MDVTPLSSLSTRDGAMPSARGMTFPVDLCTELDQDLPPLVDDDDGNDNCHDRSSTLSSLFPFSVKGVRQEAF